MKQALVLMCVPVVGLCAERAARAATCTEVTATALDIQLDPGESPTIHNEGGFLRVGNRICASAAVAWDIRVLGTAGDDRVTFSEAAGSLNGFDWEVSLGDGSDGVTFEGSAVCDQYAIGTGPAGHVFQFLSTDSRIAMLIAFDVEDFTMYGGAGDDFLRGQVSSADFGLLFFDERINLFGEAGADTMEGGLAGDVLNGGTEDDDLSGGAGNDTLRGGPGDDLLEGGDGNDKLSGQAGDDVEDGNAGNDVFDMSVVPDGDDTLDGGDGNDELSYSGRIDAVVVDLADGKGGDEHAHEKDILIAMENASGGSGDDLLVGDDERNRLEGRAGDDVIEGGHGQDQLDCGEGDDSWSDPDSVAYGSCERTLPDLPDLD